MWWKVERKGKVIVYSLSYAFVFFHEQVSFFHKCFHHFRTGIKWTEKFKEGQKGKEEKEELWKEGTTGIWKEQGQQNFTKDRKPSLVVIRTLIWIWNPYRNKLSRTISPWTLRRNPTKKIQMKSIPKSLLNSWMVICISQ